MYLFAVHSVPISSTLSQKYSVDLAWHRTRTNTSFIYYIKWVGNRVTYTYVYTTFVFNSTEIL